MGSAPLVIPAIKNVVIILYLSHLQQENSTHTERKITWDIIQQQSPPLTPERYSIEYFKRDYTVKKWHHATQPCKLFSLNTSSLPCKDARWLD